MPKKVNVGFEVDQEFKARLVNAGKLYRTNGIPFPLKLSAFCRMATEMLLKKVEEENGIEVAIKNLRSLK